MSTFKTICIVVLFINFTGLVAQEIPVLTTKDSVLTNYWTLGLGYNIVDDSGDVFRKMLNVNETWNAVPYPSRISIGRYFTNGIGLESIASYSIYKKGKIVDGVFLNEDKPYYAIDTRISYDLNKITGQTAWFDPYIGVGLGYSYANDHGRGTINGVFGFRTWISDRFGFDINSSGKWRLHSNVTNHLQHALGIIYQFNSEKGLTKEGLEKREEIETILKRQQIVLDSIALDVKRKEEERILNDKLEKDNDNERLTFIEKNKIETDRKFKEDLQTKINSLGKINFALNSSFLDIKSKAILYEISNLLKENPSIGIKLTAHTDSRGSDIYNMWLSERRMKRSLDYLVVNGILAERVNAEYFGETQLLNNCDNNIYCKESEHSVNRRIAIILE